MSLSSGMFELISEYGKLIRNVGGGPVFYLGMESYEIVSYADAEELRDERYVPYYQLSDGEKAIPGAVCKWDGVLLVMVEEFKRGD